MITDQEKQKDLQEKYDEMFEDWANEKNKQKEKYKLNKLFAFILNTLTDGYKIRIHDFINKELKNRKTF